MTVPKDAIINHKKKEIEDYLTLLKECVNSRNYAIAKNHKRKGNVDFLKKYRLSSQCIAEILTNLKLEDFCYSLPNQNTTFPEEILYVFKAVHSLDYFGDEEEVEIYIKTNIIDKDKNESFAFVISFHEANFYLQVLFPKEERG